MLPVIWRAKLTVRLTRLKSGRLGRCEYLEISNASYTYCTVICLLGHYMGVFGSFCTTLVYLMKYFALFSNGIIDIVNPVFVLHSQSLLYFNINDILWGPKV